MLHWTFDHLGLVTKSLARGRKGIGGALGITAWTPEVRDPVNGVILQFGRDRAGVVYELLEPIDETSPVHAALSTGKAILNHVAYLVPDLTAGAAPTSEPKPAIAYGGAHIQFFVTSARFIVELIEAPTHRHEFSITAFDIEKASR
jgi:methylmalonyl-CoA/ethylmalonyl-CoA epimerase